MEKLYVTKFSIVAWDKAKSCEECGVEYPPLHNFSVIACCGVEMCCCFCCNWETVPCRTCKENNNGSILINKLKNTCEDCEKEKKTRKKEEEGKKIVQIIQNSI